MISPRLSPGMTDRSICGICGFAIEPLGIGFRFRAHRDCYDRRYLKPAVAADGWPTGDNLEGWKSQGFAKDGSIKFTPPPALCPVCKQPASGPPFLYSLWDERVGLFFNYECLHTFNRELALLHPVAKPRIARPGNVEPSKDGEYVEVRFDSNPITPENCMQLDADSCEARFGNLS